MEPDASTPDPRPPPRPGRPPWEAVVAVALVAFTILAEEVALTRVFSVLFRAPYVFLIISGAIGGLGLGGLLVQSFRPSDERLRTWIVGLAVALALALALPILLLFASPWGRDLVSQAETAVVVGLPMLTFTVAGMLLSLILRQYAPWGGFLYFVDLGAAALAAPAAVVLLGLLGGINTPLGLALLAALAALLLALRARGRLSILLSLVVAAGLAFVLASNLSGRWIDLPMLRMPAEARRAQREGRAHPWLLATKPLFQELGDPFTDSRIVRTDWTAVSRTDVVYDPGQEVFYVYTDGDVPTQMVPWDGSLDTARRLYGTFIGALPYRLLGRDPDQVMAIGAGGGLDVLLALSGRAKRIDAVEINPSIPPIVADRRFGDTYARVYKEPNVRLVVDEGRSFLQRSGKYDLIYFACAKTATTQTGGVALLDNHLHTVEAFRDYWRHLTPDGMAALVTQEPHLIDRLLLTAMAAMREEGLDGAAAGNSLIVARVPERRAAEGPYRHILLMRRRAWTPAEVDRAAAAIAATDLEPIYLPGRRPRGAGGAEFDPVSPLSQIERALEDQYPVPVDPFRPASGEQPADLSAVTDDRPFYVDVAPGLHPTLAGLLNGSLAATLVVVVAAAVLGALELRRARRRPEPGAVDAGTGPLWAGMVYFAMLGAGFMLVELALMQRFILLLGFPTRSLSVTLFALLLSSALGSMSSQRGTPAAAAARLRAALPALAVLLLIYRFALPPLLDRLLPLPLWVRVAATVLFLAPPGFLMGMAFPTALRGLGSLYRRLVPALWSVNGVTSILGSVAAMTAAKFVGYSGVLLAGAGCYVIAWLAFPFVVRAGVREEATE